MTRKILRELNRPVSLKQRGYLVILSLNLIVMTMDLAKKIRDARVTPIETWLFPVSYLIVGCAIILLWRNRGMKQIEMLIFFGAAFAALIKLFDTLYLQPGAYQMMELNNLLFWMPMVYILAFIVFEHMMSSMAASLLFLSTGFLMFFYHDLYNAMDHSIIEAMMPVRFAVISAAYILLLTWIVRLKEAYQTSVAQAEHMNLLANTDPLTNTFNRRAFMDTMEHEIEKSQGYNLPLSIALFDLDNFKNVNDMFGHHVGDTILKEMSQFVQANLRRGDGLFRFGGDEFILVLPETDVQNSLLVADRLRQAVASQVFNGSCSLTISIGIAGFQQGQAIDEMIQGADQALYRAKSLGKNRVEYLN